MSTPFIDIHTHGQDTEKQGRIAITSYMVGETPLRIPYIIGIHPWQVARIADAEGVREELKRWITPRTLALGEMGLDFSITDSEAERTAQIEWFVWQLQQAAQHELPVVIHCVKAYNELIERVKNHPTPLLFHGFQGSPELAGELSRRGYYISFGAALFRSPKTREALQATPPNLVFLETDESKRPIEEIYAEASRILECEIEPLKQQIYENFLRIADNRSEC